MLKVLWLISAIPGLEGTFNCIDFNCQVQNCNQSLTVTDNEQPVMQTGFPFEPIRNLGHGGFGSVFETTWHGTPAAMKIVKYPKELYLNTSGDKYWIIQKRMYRVIIQSNYYSILFWNKNVKKNWNQ